MKNPDIQLCFFFWGFLSGGILFPLRYVLVSELIVKTKSPSVKCYLWYL